MSSALLRVCIGLFNSFPSYIRPYMSGVLVGAIAVRRSTKLLKRLILSYLILHWDRAFLSAIAEGEKTNRESFSELLYSTYVQMIKCILQVFYYTFS